MLFCLNTVSVAGGCTDETRQEPAESRGAIPTFVVKILMLERARIYTSTQVSSDRRVDSFPVVLRIDTHLQALETENKRLRDEIERQSGEQTEIFA